jgi:hypothetical protein
MNTRVGSIPQWTVTLPYKLSHLTFKKGEGKVLVVTVNHEQVAASWQASLICCLPSQKATVWDITLSMADVFKRDAQRLRS